MSYPIKPTTLMPLEEALLSMLQAVMGNTTGVETLPLIRAAGRVAAETYLSPIDLPPFANSMMDGFAMRVEDWRDGATPIPIHQRIIAGDSPRPLPVGQCARIFTGAPLPEGANAVIMQEACREDNARVWIASSPTAAWVNGRGQDVLRGATLISAGTLLSPSHLGLLASVGLAEINVHRRPKVAVVATGNELVQPGALAPQQLPHGKIFNSNQTMIETLLPAWGADMGESVWLPDDRAKTEKTLQHLTRHHDLIITLGGASVGEEDHVRAVLQSARALSLWQLAIKPGKPFMFGQWKNDQSDISDHGVCHIAGLPGNPVAAWITALLMVRPLIGALQGGFGEQAWTTDNINRALPKAVPARADFAWHQPDKKRREFLRVLANVDWQQGIARVTLMPNQKAGALFNVATADGLVDNPIGETIVPGQMVRFMPM